MPKNVTKYGIWHNGRRIHHRPAYLGGQRLPLMSKAVAERLASDWSHGLYNYEARPVRETVKSGYKARNRRSARTERILRSD